MTPDERHARIESEIEKHNTAIQGLIVVGRTCLDSIREMGDRHEKDHERFMARIEELRAAQAETDEKLNILVDTVDRIIRDRNRDN